MAKYEDILTAIIDERRRRGWSQAQLADRLGLGQSAVGNWEARRNRISAEQLVDIGLLFGWELDWFPADEDRAAALATLRQVVRELEPNRVTQLVALAKALDAIEPTLIDGLLLMSNNVGKLQTKPA